MNYEIEKFEGELRMLREHYTKCPLITANIPLDTAPVKRFNNVNNNSTLEAAIKITETLLTPNSKMMRELSVKNDFRYGSGTGADIVKQLTMAHQRVNVSYYRPWNPWSSVVGFSDGTGVYVNSRMSLSQVDLVANLLHEISHSYGFSHGDNYATEDKNRFSVPYYISANAWKWMA